MIPVAKMSWYSTNNKNFENKNEKNWNKDVGWGFAYKLKI